MDQSEIKQNYHAYLSQIKDDMDKVINEMRKQRNEKWRGQAWKGPIKILLKNLRHFKILSSIKWMSLPVIGPGLSYFIARYNNVPYWLIAIICVAVLFIIYYSYVKKYEGRMATIGDPKFHVEALKAKRPNEYRTFWLPIIQKDDFSFSGLYEALNSLLIPTNDHSIKSVLDYSLGHEDALQQTIESLQIRLHEYENAITSLEGEVDRSEDAVSNLVLLIKAINTNLYRFTNNQFSFYDMDLVSPFTLYELQDEKLVKLVDVGTSGNSLNEVDLTFSGESNYAAVSAIKSGSDDAFVSNPYPGRSVVAFTMKMLDGIKWVWCFHFDESDDRALSMILANDIIEARQVRRLIHAFCLILQKNMLLEKEGAHDNTIESSN